MKKLLRYLVGAIDIGIKLNKTQRFDAIGFCNANLGGDVTDRKNRTGFIIYVGDMLVAWSSKKQFRQQQK